MRHDVLRHHYQSSHKNNASHLLLDGEDGDVHGVRVDLELDHGPELCPAWRQPQQADYQQQHYLTLEAGDHVAIAGGLGSHSEEHAAKLDTWFLSENMPEASLYRGSHK